MSLKAALLGQQPAMQSPAAAPAVQQAGDSQVRLLLGSVVCMHPSISHPSMFIPGSMPAAACACSPNCRPPRGPRSSLQWDKRASRATGWTLCGQTLSSWPAPCPCPVQSDPCGASAPPAVRAAAPPPSRLPRGPALRPASGRPTACRSLMKSCSMAAARQVHAAAHATAWALPKFVHQLVQARTCCRAPEETPSAGLLNCAPLSCLSHTRAGTGTH